MNQQQVILIRNFITKYFHNESGATCFTIGGVPHILDSEVEIEKIVEAIEKASPLSQGIRLKQAEKYLEIEAA